MAFTHTTRVRVPVREFSFAHIHTKHTPPLASITTDLTTTPHFSQQISRGLSTTHSPSYHSGGGNTSYHSYSSMARSRINHSPQASVGTRTQYLLPFVLLLGHHETKFASKRQEKFDSGWSASRENGPQSSRSKRLLNHGCRRFSGDSCLNLASLNIRSHRAVLAMLGQVRWLH